MKVNYSFKFPLGHATVYGSKQLENATFTEKIKCHQLEVFFQSSIFLIVFFHRL